MKIIIKIFFLFLLPVSLFGQGQQGQQKEKENLGDKNIIVTKGYRPILGESMKISETPDGDNESATPPSMDYSIRARKAETEYESAVIKAVAIKDESLEKLYRNYIKLGIGNYTTYKGDLYYNALRSKKGALGLELNHHSGNPGLDDAGPAGFSNNHAGVYGKYFLDHSTFTGDINYNRNVVHYYGYDTNDTIISKDKLKQRFNQFGMLLGYGSNNLSKDQIDYLGKFGFSGLNDLYGVTENDFLVSGKVGKKISDYYANMDFSFNYFNKTLADNEQLMLTNGLSRNIIIAEPTISFNKDKVNLVLGLNFAMEKNLETTSHLFPKIDISVPFVENVLYGFAGANGWIIKNNYHTIVAENPFVTSSIQPANTINKLELKGGFKGNFSALFSFVGMVRYTTVGDMLLYINDSINYNKFNAIYVDGKVLNLHAEIFYNRLNKLNVSLRFDQYGYTMEQNEKAWHKPNTEMALTANYNVWDKLLLNATILAYGKYDVRIQEATGFSSKKVSGYMDANLGVEYRYSKILSFFVNFNNLGFVRYNRWYNYPSERLNVLGGLSYSF